MLVYFRSNEESVDNLPNGHPKTAGKCTEAANFAALARATNQYPDLPSMIYPDIGIRCQVAF
jgi:hypothetical protein